MEIVNIIKEHVEWRHQIGKLAKADLKKTYSGAALGWAWALIKPAVTIFVYWFAFSTGLRDHAGIEGFPFFLWMLAGIIPWFYISEMLNQGTNSMRRYKHLITKMKFPVSTIPTFVSMSKLSIHLVLLACVFVIYGLMGYIREPIYYIQIPFYMFLLFMFCTAWALFGSVLAAMSKDFLNLVKAFTTALFWLSGIMFSITKIHAGWAHALMKFNPVTYTVEGYRNCFIYHKWFFEDPQWLCVYLAELVIMWVLGIWVFKKLKKDMPDVL